MGNLITYFNLGGNKPKDEVKKEDSTEQESPTEVGSTPSSTLPVTNPENPQELDSNQIAKDDLEFIDIKKIQEEDITSENPELDDNEDKFDDSNKIQGIGGMINEIVLSALNKSASDVHIEPTEKYVLVRFRIDGILHDVYKIDIKYHNSLIFKIKVNAKLRTDEHFAPQDGRIQFDFDGKLDTRISILPTAKGEKVVIRLLTEQGKSFKLEDLGMGEKDLIIVKKNYMKPYGCILVSGPTGSGKTTTLYSILKIINSREKNITTVEDPVEYEIEGVNQVQINTKAELTFAKGLRSILRQDPDIIMIGEIRDAETAEIAINSAMTGHLVLSTIHTNDAITTVPRLIEMGVDPYLVANTINTVIAQRLARKLCDKCKKKKVISQKDLDELGVYRPDIVTILKAGDTVYEEAGCESCTNGFKGRIGLYEVLEINESLRNLILERKSSDEIFKIARANNFILILEDGVDKIRKGLISLNELVRVTALRE